MSGNSTGDPKDMLSADPKADVSSGGSGQPTGKIQTMGLSAKDIPAIKDWQKGKTYELKVTMKMISDLKGDTAKFRIVSVDAGDNNGGQKKDMSNFDGSKLSNSDFEKTLTMAKSGQMAASGGQ